MNFKISIQYKKVKLEKKTGASAIILKLNIVLLIIDLSNKKREQNEQQNKSRPDLNARFSLNFIFRWINKPCRFNLCLIINWI